MSLIARSPVSLEVPGTSANLGPGFDTLGLALSLSLEIRAEQAGSFSIVASGRDPSICGSLTNNLILMTYSEVLGSMGLAAPPLRLEIQNGIPIGMGCGSSAAALVAGVLLADHFGGLGWSKEQILHEAAAREGHPDNVAACVLGGVTASLMHASHTTAFSFCSGLPWRTLLALPRMGLKTTEARAVLPTSVSRADAVANLQATALLVAALCHGRADLLPAAMRDRLHQPFREGVCPLYSKLKSLEGAHGVHGLALSGAGPAVLLFVEQAFPHESIVQVAGDELAELLEVEIAAGARMEIQ